VTETEVEIVSIEEVQQQEVLAQPAPKSDIQKAIIQLQVNHFISLCESH